MSYYVICYKERYIHREKKYLYFKENIILKETKKFVLRAVEGVGV